jgi:AsmA-like C-terminal region
VHTFTTTPQLDLQVTTNRFTPEALLTQLPMLASMVPAPTDVHGKVQLQATVKGAPHDLRSEAQIDLQEIMLKSGSFSGGAPAGGGMLVETDKTQARLAMQVAKADPPRVHIDVRAQRLVFDQQRPHAPAPTQTAAPTADAQPRPATQPAPAQPTLPPLILSGQVSIAEGRIQQLNFQQMTADLSLVERILKSTQQMKLYDGSYQGATQVDLTQPEPSYSLDARVAGLNIGRALDDLTPAKNTLLGVLDTDVHLSGRGFARDVLQKTLSGDGHVKIADAQLTHFDLVPQLMHLLQHIGALVGFPLPSDWEQSSWRTIEGDWRLQQGKILNDYLRLRREGVEALLSGHVGLDQAIEYTGTLFLPAKVIARRGVPLILRQDDAGRVMVPFTVQGTVSAPRISVDEQALMDRAKEELVETVRKRLGGKVDELLGQPSASDPPRQEPDKTTPETGERPRRPRWPEKILQDLFRR